MSNTVLSLDDIERAEWNPGPAPFESPFVSVSLQEGALAPRGDDVRMQSLDGDWIMAPDGYSDERTDLSNGWSDSIPCPVPCGVHTALMEAGVIEDPLFGKNDKRAREWSYHTWWFKREFDYDGSLTAPQLWFDGVCYNARFWLNGKYLGCHRGMFGGPFYDVAPYLQEHNTLIVKIENAPADPQPYSEYADFDDGWSSGVVVNCVYGWHYACLPTRGIWAPVKLISRPASIAEKPFIVVTDPHKGLVDLCIKLRGRAGKGRLYVSVEPYTFEGKSYHFEQGYEAAEGETALHYQMQIPDPQLWWPNGIGAQNLYTMQIWIEPENDLVQHFEEHFGLRRIEMAPLPGGPYADKHNWTFVINGRKVFVKGTNWCTTDALMRFPKERYDRFLTLAKDQGLQLLRAWGGGMPESDYFYDTCDKFGLMVFQEWPTCWGSQKKQPMGELMETAFLHTIRLRNHPSLIQWAGGNESVGAADGEAMDRMARLAYELDGTREFHRTSPWGGALHNYDTYWGRQDVDCTIHLMAPFMGEFGYASAPNLRSVRRYLPREEWDEWDLDAKNCFNYHTPRFNEWQGTPDIERLGRRVNEYYDDKTMEHWIIGTQLAQAETVRHTLEAYRCNWPESTGICYYKLTDVYPACSWSTLDYYGVPKLSHYFVKSAYKTLHGALVFKSMHAKASLLGAPEGVIVDKGVVTVPAGSPEFFSRYAERDLDPAKTYTYRFTLHFEGEIPEHAAVRIPVRTNFKGFWTPGDGQWLCLRLYLGQVILSEDFWGDKAKASKAFTFTAGEDHTFEVVTTPTSMTLAIDGQPALVADGFEALEEPAKIGVGQYNMPDFALQNCYLAEEGSNVNQLTEFGLDVPVYLLDDAYVTADKAATLIVRAFNECLEEISSQTYEKAPGEVMNACLGNFTLTAEQIDTAPLLITLDAMVDGELCDRTFYWMNTRYRPSCLFDRPQTALSYKVVDATTVEVTNVGTLPALGVTVECPEKDDSFMVEDSAFWLNAGESRRLTVNETDGLEIKAWNAPVV